MGKPAAFPAANVTLAPAPGDVGKVLEAPARYEDGCLVTFWELSDLELLEVVNAKGVWASQNVGRSPPPPLFVTGHQEEALGLGRGAGR